MNSSNIRGVATASSLIFPNSSSQNANFRCLVCQSRLQLHPSVASSSSSSHEPSCIKLNQWPTLEDDEEIEGRLILGKDQFDGVGMTGGVAQAGNLLDLISKSNNPLEVPMCKKCANSIQQELDRQLEGLKTECDHYKQSLNQLLSQKSQSNFDPEAAKRKLHMLEVEERELLDELGALQVEERSLNQELEQKMEERKQMAERDEQLYRQLRDNHRTLLEQSEEQRSLQMQLKTAQEQLQKLQRVNVLDMAFFIWMDGEYGTINGLRLGRLKHDLVEWHEINAALGQCAFLLTVIAERLAMQFANYEVVPCASFSFIRARRSSGKVDELPLYGNGGWRPFGQSSLDQALVAYIECFSQVEQHLRQYFPENIQILPYRIVKDKLVDKNAQYLVKMQLNSEERWTKAMKCLLLNLKRVVSILATLSSNGTLPPQQAPFATADQHLGQNLATPSTHNFST